MITKNIIPFKDDEILTFYNLVYYVEKEIKQQKPRGFNVQDRKFKKFCSTLNIVITKMNSATIEQEKQNLSVNHIYFTNNKNNHIASILVHLRNAICHIQIEDKNKYIEFYDIYNKRLGMIASLEKKLFTDFINSMKDTRKINYL